MNILIASGNLGGDPETRMSKSGTAVSTFSLPVRQGWGDNEKTTWVRCVLFGKKGSHEPHGLVPYLKKGQLVTVQGEIVLEEWEKDGEKHSMLKCLVREIVAPKTSSARPSDDYPEASRAAKQAIDEGAAIGDLDDDIPF